MITIEILIGALTVFHLAQGQVSLHNFIKASRYRANWHCVDDL